MTWHGFRTIASTCLNQLGWHPDLVELQLAHAERNEVHGASNRAQRLPERRSMMQAWANYLDQLRVVRTHESSPGESILNRDIVRDEITKNAVSTSALPEK